MRIGRKIAIACAALLTTATLATAALAARAQATAPAMPGADSTTQAKVDYFLAISKDGKQTAPNEISFEDGKVILTVAPAEGNSVQAADCAALYACLYDGTNFGYPRLALTDCGTYTLSNYGFANITSSIHNTQSSNTQTYILNSSSQILNANRAPSKVNDVGVGGTNRAVRWLVC